MAKKPKKPKPEKEKEHREHKIAIADNEGFIEVTRVSVELREYYMDVLIVF